MPQSKRINSDGKNWTFTPGKNGSLVSSPVPTNQIVDSGQVQATSKSMMDPSIVKKNRMNLIRAIVGSTRG